MVCVVIVNIASIICMGLIIAREPLSNPEHEIIHHDHNPADSPYKHGIYYGWAIAAGTAVAICAGLPIYSWFTTFRLSKSSMFCLATCLGKCSLLVLIPGKLRSNGILGRSLRGASDLLLFHELPTVQVVQNKGKKKREKEERNMLGDVPR